MKRVRSLFHYADDTGGEFFPHLYERDIERLQSTVERMSKQNDAEMQDFALLLTRVLDWIATESNAVSNSVRLIALREDDESVIVRNLETGCEGRGEDLLSALDDLVVNIEDVRQNLLGILPDERNDLDNLVLAWLEEYPYP